jgi:two-component system, OmpR family, phosphate regulon sensor histidine kinase PhoR
LIDADTETENIIETFNVQIRQKGGSVTLKKSGEHFRINGNLDLFQIAIGNIVDNSIKYCTDTPVIAINLTSSDGVLSIEIDDNGPGIPREFQDRIFDKYFRVQSGEGYDNNGFGLGLYQVKNIISKMGGKIKVTNLKGKGLRLSIELPLATGK